MEVLGIEISVSGRTHQFIVVNAPIRGVRATFDAGCHLINRGVNGVSLFSSLCLQEKEDGSYQADRP